jgi:uncharacterized membrane protein YuzA (DUF378 family)
MFWAGGLIGAIFGLVGIFVAACLYLFYALIKLVFLLAAFTAQLIFAISGLIARLIIYAYHQIRSRNATPPAAPRTKKRVPAGLKPTRVARKRKSKPRG